MEAITTNNLAKTYKTLGKPPVHSLHPLNLTVRENEVFGFLGRNGAGKTTTIKLLTGLIRPSVGEAHIFGTNARMPESRKHIGYMPEHPYFYEYLTPKETLDFYGRLRGLNAAARRREWSFISELLDLGDIADRRIRGFSKGMRQRVGFAVALAGDPPLLILDEPMSGLDPLGRRMFRQLIHRLRDAGKTLFFSSHVLSDVEEVCDRVGILVGGRLAACGSIEELVGHTPKSVEVCAGHVDDALVARLSGQGIVSEINSESGRCMFCVPDLNSANALARELCQANVPLFSMHPRLESLEDFFTRIQEGAGVALPEDNEISVLTSKAEE